MTAPTPPAEGDRRRAHPLAGEVLDLVAGVAAAAREDEAPGGGRDQQQRGRGDAALALQDEAPGRAWRPALVERGAAHHAITPCGP